MTVDEPAVTVTATSVARVTALDTAAVLSAGLTSVWSAAIVAVTARSVPVFSAGSTLTRMSTLPSWPVSRRVTRQVTVWPWTSL
ncbi:MAG TPA: hypothetical protein VH395_06700 [Jatrophihabitantaceae bacterium]|jgi:hypothetical protein